MDDKAPIAAPPPPNTPHEVSHGSWLRTVARELLGMIVVLGICALLLLPLVKSFKAEKAAIEKERQATARVSEVASVVVTELQAVTVEDKIRLPGIVEPYQDITLGAEVAGRVTQRPVDDGAQVQQGDLLLVIEEADYRIGLDRAKARLELAEADLKRTTKLLTESVATTADLENVTNAFRQAQADVNAATLALARCRITSPIAGVVNDVLPELGELLKVGDKVAEVMDIRRVKVEVGIPEQDIAAVRQVTECDIRISALKDDPVRRGRKTYLSVKTLDLARVYALRLELDNPDGAIRPGMFVDAEVLKATRSNAVLAPLFAILPGEAGHAAFVVEPTADTPAAPGTAAGTGWLARRRAVKLGVVQGHRVEITDGLKPGDKLIVMGQRGVADGGAVSIVRTVRDLAELAR